MSTARKDLLRRWKDPAALALWIGIPLLIGALMTLINGGSDGKAPQAHVLIADEDGTFLSGLLVRAFQMDGSDDGLFRTETVTREVGQARIGDGDGSALLVIPDGFGEALLAEEASELLLVKNPAQRILPGLAEELLNMVSDAAFYIHRILGDEIRTIVAGTDDNRGPFPDANVAEISVSVNHAVQRFERYLFPPVIELKVSEPVDEENESRPKTPIGLLFLPGILIMALFFVGQGLSEDIWQERQSGTLRRAACSPHSIAIFLLGKGLAATAVIVCVNAVSLLAGWLTFDIPVRLLVPALAWATCSGISLWAGMLILQLLATSRRAGSILTSAVLFPLVMLGGSFFPFEAMPPWMVEIGSLTPNGWALNHLRAILLEQRVTPASWAALAGLALATAFLIGCATLRLRKVMVRP